MEFHDIRQCCHSVLFNFVISRFAFDVLESLPQSFGLILTLLNFQNFEFSDGER